MSGTDSIPELLAKEPSKAPHMKQAIANESVRSMPKLAGKTLLGLKTAQGHESTLELLIGCCNHKRHCAGYSGMH